METDACACFPTRRSIIQCPYHWTPATRGPYHRTPSFIACNARPAEGFIHIPSSIYFEKKVEKKGGPFWHDSRSIAFQPRFFTRFVVELEDDGEGVKEIPWNYLVFYSIFPRYCDQKEAYGAIFNEELWVPFEQQYERYQPKDPKSLRPFQFKMPPFLDWWTWRSQ